MADLNSYQVDRAGYVISTETRVRGLAGRVMELAEDLRPGAEHPNIFDLQLTREDVAASLEEIAEQAATIAKMFRDPQVDERDSPLVGYDAAHSLSR